MEKTGISVNLNVPQKGTLEITDEASKAVFETQTGKIVLVFAKNLTKEKEQAWREIAKIVLLGRNYKPKGGTR